MRSSPFRLLASLALVTTVVTGCIQLTPATPPSIAGVYKSVDFSENWAAKNMLLATGGVGDIGNVSVASLTFDPQDLAALYLGTTEDGLLYSYDGGESWQQSRGLRKGKVFGLAVDPHDRCTVYATLNNTILKSNDCVRSWSEIYIDTVGTKVITALAMDPNLSNVLYSGNSAGDLLKSSDSGITWRVVKRVNARITKILVDPAAPSILYAATDRRGLFKSTNSGEEWVELNDGLKKFSGAFEYKDLRFIPDTSNGLLLTSKYGILRTVDGGGTWEPLALITPPTTTDIFAVTVNPKNGKEVYYATATTFYKSVDGGANWITKRLPSTAVPSLLLANPNDPNIMYLAFTVPPQK